MTSRHRFFFFHTYSHGGRGINVAGRFGIFPSPTTASTISSSSSGLQVYFSRSFFVLFAQGKWIQVYSWWQVEGILSSCTQNMKPFIPGFLGTQPKRQRSLPWYFAITVSPTPSLFNLMIFELFIQNDWNLPEKVNFWKSSEKRLCRVCKLFWPPQQTCFTLSLGHNTWV